LYQVKLQVLLMAGLALPRRVAGNGQVDGKAMPSQTLVNLETRKLSVNR
jgi:hypothetical protein